MLIHAMLAWCPLFSDTETLESMCHSSAAVCPWANGKAECDFERRSINKIVNAKICHSSEAAQFLAWLLPAVASLTSFKISLGISVCQKSLDAPCKTASSMPKLHSRAPERETKKRLRKFPNFTLGKSPRNARFGATSPE